MAFTDGFEDFTKYQVYSFKNKRNIIDRQKSIQAKIDNLRKQYNSGEISADEYYTTLDAKMAEYNALEMERLNPVSYTDWKRSMSNEPTKKENTASTKKESTVSDVLKGVASGVYQNLDSVFNRGIDPKGESTGLREQADELEKQAAKEKANEQKNTQIANRDYRVEADKNAAAQAAFKNAQTIQNMGAATGNATAALNRTVNNPEYDTHMQRQDTQREKAVEKQREAQQNKSSAIRRRTGAQGKDYDWQIAANANRFNTAASLGMFNGNDTLSNNTTATRNNLFQENTDNVSAQENVGNISMGNAQGPVQPENSTQVPIQPVDNVAEQKVSYDQSQGDQWQNRQWASPSDRIAAERNQADADQMARQNEGAASKGYSNIEGLQNDADADQMARQNEGAASNGYYNVEGLQNNIDAEDAWKTRIAEGKATDADMKKAFNEYAKGNYKPGPATIEYFKRFFTNAFNALSQNYLGTNGNYLSDESIKNIVNTLTEIKY